jgi:hypothetical protein
MRNGPHKSVWIMSKEFVFRSEDFGKGVRVIFPLQHTSHVVLRLVESGASTSSMDPTALTRSLKLTCRKRRCQISIKRKIVVTRGIRQVSWYTREVQVPDSISNQFHVSIRAEY